MITALKMTAASTALAGVRRNMMFIFASAGYVVMNIAGMMAKYFDTSFMIENVVSAPRVMSSCLPIATTSISFVGLLSRSTMLPASRPAGGRGERRRGVGAVAGHRDHAPAGLLLPDVLELVLRRRLRDEVVHAGL